MPIDDYSPDRDTNAGIVPGNIRVAADNLQAQQIVNAIRQLMADLATFTVGSGGTALQPADIGVTVQGWDADLDAFDPAAFATAAQGTLAGTALQPVDIGVTVQSWAGIVSVMDFGVVGDGTADDTNAIIAAAASGEALVWPRGTYRITDWLRFENEQVWTAVGTATILCDVAAASEAQPMCDFQAFCDIRGDFLFDMQAPTKGFTTPVNPINASAVVVAGDYSNIDGIRVQNAYDNGIAVVALDGAGDPITGVPSRVTISNIRTKDCGFGTKTGAGIDVATGKYTVVTNCVDSESYTGFIVDTGAGAQCSMSNMISVGAQRDGETGGFGFYLGSNECTYTNLHAQFSENIGIWLDGYHCTLTGCQTNLTQRNGVWIKRGSHCTIDGLIVNSASTAAHNTYDSILIDSSGEVMDGLRINSPIIRSSGGTQARYAIMHTGANAAKGCIAFPDITGHATGGINIGGQPFTIIGTDGFNAGTWGSPKSKWDVLGSFSSYAVEAAGDTGNNSVFSASSTITPEKRIAIGYDDTNDIGIIQAIHAGITKKELALNPSGGWVIAERGIWNEGSLKFLNGYHLWVDGSGDLRIKSSSPTSDADGAPVGGTAGTALQPADIGVTVQAWDADLDSLAGIGLTAAGLALLNDANAAAQRTTLGLGTAAVAASADFATAAQGTLAGTALQPNQDITISKAGHSFLRVNATDASNTYVRLQNPTGFYDMMYNTSGQLQFNNYDSAGVFQNTPLLFEAIGTPVFALNPTIPALPGLSSSVQSTGIPGLDGGSWFLWENPGSFEDGPTLRVDRHVNASGGIAGNTYSALWVLASSHTSGEGFEWAGKFQFYNKTANTSGAENLALNATAFLEDEATQVGKTWAANFNLVDLQGSVNPTMGRVSVEIDNYSTSDGGTDASRARVLVQLAFGSHNGTPSGGTPLHIGRGFLVGGNAANVIMDRLMEVGGSGTYDIGIDTTAATFTKPVLFMSEAQAIAFDGNTSGAFNRSLYYQTGLLAYKVTGSVVTTITDSGDLGSVGYINTGNEFRVDNVRVVGNRDTGWTAWAGASNESASLDTSTVALGQLAQRVAAIQIALTTHGLIGA